MSIQVIMESLFDHNAAFSDDGAPKFDVLRNISGEFLSGGTDRLETECQHTFLYARQPNDLIYIGTDFLDDVSGHVGRSKHAIPTVKLEPVVAKFLKGGNIRGH